MDTSPSAVKAPDSSVSSTAGDSSPLHASGPRAAARIGISHTPGVPSDPVASPLSSKSPSAAAAAPVVNEASPNTSDMEDDVDEETSADEDSDMEDDDQPPQPAPPTPEQLAAEAAARALEFKDKGNESYKAGEYAEAVAHYTSAVNLVPTDAMYYANRAAAYLMLNKFKDVLEDCAKTHAIDPLHVKAHLRAGKAYFKLVCHAVLLHRCSAIAALLEYACTVAGKVC
jgi:tetratricopeptide (TPR) repeat protein